MYFGLFVPGLLVGVFRSWGLLHRQANMPLVTSLPKKKQKQKLRNALPKSAANTRGQFSEDSALGGLTSREIRRVKMPNIEPLDSLDLLTSRMRAQMIRNKNTYIGVTATRRVPCTLFFFFFFLVSDS